MQSDYIGVFKVIKYSGRNCTVECPCGELWTSRKTRIKDRNHCPKCLPKVPFKHRKPGETINGHILIERLPSRKWKARCKCGNIRICSPCDLERYETCSACYDALKVGKKRRLGNNKALYNSRIAYYKRGARNRNIEWNLSDKQAISLFNSPCYYCGTASSMTTSSKDRTIDVNGIDRIENHKDYTINNCIPCCKFCNHAKNNHSSEEFISYIKRIYEFQFNDYPEREYTQVSGNAEPLFEGEDIVCSI